MMLLNPMMRRHAKALLAVVTALLVVTAILETHESYVNKLKDEFYKEHMTGPQAVINSACVLPRYEPYDPSIMHFIKSWPKIDCGSPQPPLTYVDDKGYLHINKTAVPKLKYPWEKLGCYHYEIIRLKNDDDRIKLGPGKVFFDPERLPHEFSVVRCLEEPRKKLIYETGYAQIKEMPKSLSNKSEAAARNGRVNALIFVFDSMSRLNFIRQLPKTSKFIQERVKGFVMEGLTKVGDNTYPNMLSLLSGFSASRYRNEKALRPFWGNASAPRGYFDDLPALWKNFSQNDYVTMFSEDFPKFTAFNYNAHGFKVPPTDYYMRPFWLAMENQKHRLSKDFRCYGNVPKYKFLLNYVKDFVCKMQKEGHAFFSLTFLTHLSHDHINSIKIIDDELLLFFESLEVLNVFRNSVVIIMGDHGNRFDPIRGTVIGRVEERMPFLAITLPPSLEHFRSSLAANSKILTSWHDVYEMLMDVAFNNLKAVSKVVRYGFKGLSLFRPIPSNRTCLQIGIPREYCVCWVEKELDVNDPKTKKTGETLVRILNEQLHQKDKKKLCTPLQLDSVKNAQKLMPSATVARRDDLSVITRITITVKPSNALLEGTLEAKALRGIYLVGNVNRLNKYGNQSDCVTDPTLALFCFCKRTA
ncbi:Hypothetical predicted protein [Cloeon dipterum]|uniref:Sulfatase N-terminal domain-containing protein n=1 Tax=Cloeon dipterum TaxID=197152 RepID=A0A8S1E353_9INSE|nr:Hypothetical predicted protein [Cloeon dipterum]